MQFDYPQLHWQDAEEQRITLHCYYHSRFVFMEQFENQSLA
ncbi:FIG01046247: hypothetical protein [Salmonella enterica subsp. enterica serovar Typhimurium]|nr:FIG01046247: hypothetical protein [Salmonella enterica subsp. enterica serovar Typhimurium]